MCNPSLHVCVVCMWACMCKFFILRKFSFVWGPCICLLVCVCVCLPAWEQSANYAYWVSLLLTLPKCSNLADAHKQMIYWGERELNKVTREGRKDNEDKGFYIYSKYINLNQMDRHRAHGLCHNFCCLLKFCVWFFAMSHELALCLLDRHWITQLLFLVMQLDN